MHALPTFNATDDAWLLQDVTVVQEVSVCVSDGVIECVSMSVWAKVSERAGARVGAAYLTRRTSPLWPTRANTCGLGSARRH